MPQRNINAKNMNKVHVQASHQIHGKLQSSLKKPSTVTVSSKRGTSMQTMADSKKGYKVI